MTDLDDFPEPVEQVDEKAEMIRIQYRAGFSFGIIALISLALSILLFLHIGGMEGLIAMILFFFMVTGFGTIIVAYILVARSSIRWGDL